MNIKLATCLYLTALMIVGSQVPIIIVVDSLHVPCRRVPTYTTSMTISKTERSRVRNIYGNAVTPAFPLARHTFRGTAFPCVPAPLHPCWQLSCFIYVLIVVVCFCNTAELLCGKRCILVIDTAGIVCSRVCVTVRCPSVCLSVPAVEHCNVLWAWQAGDIDWLLHGRLY